MIVCTSGTTGLPKGVRLSHAVLVNYSSRGLHLNDEDIYLTMISLNWITAICALVYCTVQGATRVITTAPFSEETFLRIVEQRKVNLFGLAGTLSPLIFLLVGNSSFYSFFSCELSTEVAQDSLYRFNKTNEVLLWR